MLREGDVVAGRFELGAELGRGGMGVVYRAHDRALRRPVALKLLSRFFDPRHRARFEREGELMAALRHPGFVTVHAAGTTEDGVPYLACELVEGARPLLQATAEAPLRRRVELVRDVARALGYAHARGIVHRDVKSDNLLVGADGAVRIADLGVAVALDSERLTQTGQLVGTPMFLAPERVDGRREDVTPAADVWALGATLYELLTGRRPFPQESFLAYVRAIDRAPAPPSSLAPGVPPELDAIVLATLAPDPGRRLPHGELLAAELDRWLAGERPRAAAPRRGGGLVLAAGAAVGFGVVTTALLAWQPEGVPPAAAPPPARTPPRSPPSPGLVGPWAVAAGTTLRYDLELGEMTDKGDPPHVRLGYDFRAQLVLVARAAREGATPFEARLRECTFNYMGMVRGPEWFPDDPFELLLEPDGRVRAVSGVDAVRERVLTTPRAREHLAPDGAEALPFPRFVRALLSPAFLTRALGLLLHAGPPWEPGPLEHVRVLPPRAAGDAAHLLPLVFTGEHRGQTLWHRREDKTHAGAPLRSELRLDPVTGRTRRAKVCEMADYSGLEAPGELLQLEPLAIWTLTQRAP